MNSQNMEMYLVVANILLLVYVVYGVIESIKQNKRKYKQKNILSWLRGTSKPEDFNIEDKGDAIDRCLVMKDVAIAIINQSRQREDKHIRVIAFSSIFDDECTDQMDMLLGTISKLDCIDIDWVNDMTPTLNRHKFVNMIKRKLIRCDKLLNEKDISIKTLRKYDIIFHPRAGLNASYEIMAHVLIQLGASSEQKTS